MPASETFLTRFLQEYVQVSCKNSSKPLQKCCGRFMQGAWDYNLVRILARNMPHTSKINGKTFATPVCLHSNCVLYTKRVDIKTWSNDNSAGDNEPTYSK